MPEAPDKLRREIQADEYARACEQWMLKIRQVAAQSYTGYIFKGAVESGLGTLARDAENQIVVVSANKQFSTVVDRGLKGTFDPFEYQRWVSSIDRGQLPTKYEVREGLDHTADQRLVKTFKALHERQAADSAALTQKRDQQLDMAQFKDPKHFLIHMQTRREQSAAFEAERGRYLRQHHAAERTREQLLQDEFDRSARPDKSRSKDLEP
jgi:hypothetical protein